MEALWLLIPIVYVGILVWLVWRLFKALKTGRIWVGLFHGTAIKATEPFRFWSAIAADAVVIVVAGGGGLCVAFEAATYWLNHRA